MQTCLGIFHIFLYLYIRIDVYQISKCTLNNQHSGSTNLKQQHSKHQSLLEIGGEMSTTKDNVNLLPFLYKRTKDY